MRSQILLIGFTLSVTVFLGVALYTPLLNSPALIIENTIALPRRQARPVRLKIPTIGVDAAVEYVGLAPDGAMDVPKDRDNVAWFELGARPGEAGSAVIAGHYGWENKRGSAFDNLHALRKGDQIFVEDTAGAITTFVVRENRRYDPDADTAGIFGSSDGMAHLNLVTCEGVWDEALKGYSRRLVVFTDRE